MGQKSKPPADDNDFVFTLSDDEGFAIDVDETEDISEETSAAETKISKKRKREQNATSQPSKQTKKQKKQEQKQSKKGEKVELERDYDAGIVTEEEKIDEGEDDGVLNPDFEFDIGGNATRDVIEDFDGWGADDGKQKAAGGNKKAVDIDDIIARRKQRKEEEIERKKRKAERKGEQDFEGFGSEEEYGDDDEEEDVGMPNFDDDELLAADGFGMGVDGAEPEEDRDEEQKSSDEEDDSEADDHDNAHSDDESDAESDDSVASPVAHPDDIASGEESESESENAEEIAKRKAFFAPEEPASADKDADDAAHGSFQNYNLSRPILRGLAAVGFTKPTPIQRKAIPVALLGKDVVGGAVTGSGKTGAFIIPILERLLYRPRKVPTSRVAILMPTRELAVQCYNVATKLATYTDITFCQLIGGFSLREQENVLKKRPDIIIATPGRFIDHMRNSASFTVDTLEILVLDEADRMLEDGFADELNEILTTIPKSRQTMLFSATMTDSVDKLIRVGLNRPVRLMVDAKKQTAGTLVQEFVRLRPGREDKRLASLIHLCQQVYAARVIIFFRQKKEAHRVRVIFGLFGLKAAELHGSMSQEQRIKSVEDFRDGKVAFLLATDVASRGLDIKGVETVINYEAPQTHEIYLHRVGRTARAGRSGRACTLAADPDRKVVRAAVKAGKTQGAKIVSRVIGSEIQDKLAEEIEGLRDEVDAILREEKEEKELAQVEMQTSKGENLLKHQTEIMSRPKRTWFETEKEKQEAQKRGLIELNGLDASLSKKEKRKLSGKEKKRLDDTRDRKEGRMWKKGKKERESNIAPPKKGSGKKGGNKMKGKKGRK
ncbi:ATP-dependent RNA helicase (Drs1), putative [Talaromyces stipitatus ATCC 10500]|uniref:RNA helicase n=1 Tax=Talaromyces stipitatus (strain ATCC 10500 / CBS 375.48 / QM 6759 / NRRL 1006) TaxID=441959 RepID=B8M2V3_TALSN|nr:ATP-dependent RNA helicase (Drs1), putative [Talaromyces stipitatus ATCC 10500]EED22208.1 ATP-dependent RNA helicase (Drs1), putative [Talaromyces stipitatus ATCC 10500]